MTFGVEPAHDVTNVSLANADVGRELVETDDTAELLSMRERDDDVGGDGLVVERGHGKSPMMKGLTVW